MKDDLLTRAAEALREDSDGTSDGAKFTRARVMASLHQRAVRRRTRLAFVLPLAASFAAATAWGTASGRAPEIARSVARALGFADEGPAAVAPSPKRAPGRKVPPAVAPKAPDAATSLPQPPVAPPADAAPEPSMEQPQRAPATRSARPAASSSAGDAAHELYRAAHHAHFVEHDCANAVEAWALYLRAAPKGRFALEAAYNRALCQLRLGQRDAAARALGPFARGEHGTYRQREAAALLGALGQSRH